MEKMKMTKLLQKLLASSQSSLLMEKKWKRRKKGAQSLLKWERNPSLSLYKELFAFKSSSILFLHILGQIKTPLINLRSNETKCIMKVDVLFEIHTLVSRISVFDEIRENSYLQKGPQFTLVEFKLILINSIPSKFTSLGLIQSFEINSSHFVHKSQLAQLIMLKYH